MTEKKVIMVSVLDDKANRLVDLLKENGFSEEVTGEIIPAMVEYDVIAGYLAHLRSAKDTETRNGLAYVIEPDIKMLDYTSPMQSGDVVFYRGLCCKPDQKRKTLHFLGYEETLPSKLKELIPIFELKYGHRGFVHDLADALGYWE